MIDSPVADHLHGGEAAMLDFLIGRLLMSGVPARAAILPTPGVPHMRSRVTAA